MTTHKCYYFIERRQQKECYSGKRSYLSPNQPRVSTGKKPLPVAAPTQIIINWIKVNSLNSVRHDVTYVWKSFD